VVGQKLEGGGMFSSWSVFIFRRRATLAGLVPHATACYTQGAMKGDTPKSDNRPQQATILAFVASTWFALLPLIIGWNAVLEGGDPGVGLGIISWIALAISPVVGWAFSKNISVLGVQHAQKPALAAAILVGAIWAGGLYVHLTGALWLVKCEGLGDADACLAAGNYFDSGDAAFQGTIDAKELWADACSGGGEHGWKACRKIVHRVGYRTLACESLNDHCNADERNMGACWDWSVVCNRADFVDDEVDAVERKIREQAKPVRPPITPKLASKVEQDSDYQLCLDRSTAGVSAECDRTLDRGILSRRRAVCEKIEHDCEEVGDWPCRFTMSRCEIMAANPFD
jgi:hypothetical protein